MMSGHGLFVACVASLAGAIAAPVVAVAPTGGAVEDLRRVASTFADCVVRVDAPLARGIILQNLQSGEIVKNRVARHIVNDACMLDNGSVNAIGPAVPSGMRFGGDLFRYSLADALIRKDYPTPGQFDFSAKPPLDHRDPMPLAPALASGTSSEAMRAQKRYSMALATSLFSRFGECVCRRAPGSVQKLLHSPVATDAERAAFAEIAPLLGQCLSSGQMRLSREVVRGLLALNFYRLAGAPAGVEVTKLKDGPDA